MDRASALDELPEAHAVALRLRDAGHDDQAIATALGIDLEAVEPLLRVAVAKLSALMTDRDDPAHA
jgi:DNA-directed RNA polymerase specialized sigma24 family protein